MIIAKYRRDKALVRAALDAQVPMVAIAPDEALANVAVVRADNIAAGRALGAHLAELGHTRWRLPAGRASRSSPAIVCKFARGAQEARYPDARGGHQFLRQLRG